MPSSVHRAAGGLNEDLLARSSPNQGNITCCALSGDGHQIGKVGPQLCETGINIQQIEKEARVIIAGFAVPAHGTVTRIGNRLAMVYDAAGGQSIEHLGRDIGLAWYDLPLTSPAHR